MGAAPLPEVHSVQNNKRFMGSSSGDPENMPDKHKFNKKQKPNPMQKGDTKAKNDTKWHRCGTFNHFAKDCRTPKTHLVALYQKCFKEAKQSNVKVTRYEANFNLAPDTTKEVCCSSMAPMEPNDNHYLMNEKLPSTDDMLIEFSLNDMFGDFI
jgi:hypothetical protein